MRTLNTVFLGALLTLVCAGSAQAYECKTNVIKASTKSENFIINGDGTITDLRFGLMWNVCTYGQSYNAGNGNCEGEPIATENWAQAMMTQSDVNSARLYGINDWRLPSIKELQSIVERQCRQPAINLNIFKGTVNGVYWSNTPDGQINNGLKGRIIDFSDGVEFYRATAPKKFVRHVRSVN
jgi:hypothetical protein